MPTDQDTVIEDLKAEIRDELADIPLQALSEAVERWIRDRGP